MWHKSCPLFPQCFNFLLQLLLNLTAMYSTIGITPRGNHAAKYMYTVSGCHLKSEMLTTWGVNEAEANMMTQRPMLMRRHTLISSSALCFTTSCSWQFKNMTNFGGDIRYFVPGWLNIVGMRRYLPGGVDAYASVISTIIPPSHSCLLCL